MSLDTKGTAFVYVDSAGPLSFSLNDRAQSLWESNRCDQICPVLRTGQNVTILWFPSCFEIHSFNSGSMSFKLLLLIFLHARLGVFTTLEEMFNIIQMER